ARDSARDPGRDRQPLGGCPDLAGREAQPMTTYDADAEKDAAITALEELARQATAFATFLRTHPDVTAEASADDVKVATGFFTHFPNQVRETSRRLKAWQHGLRRHS